MTIETSEVTCPSGLTGLVRPLTIADIKMLSSKEARKKDITSRLVSNVWVETLDLGVYSESIAKPGGPVDWNRALLGDRAFMIYEIRRLTHGNDFFFELNCQACKNRLSMKVDLSEVETSHLSEDAKSSIESKGIDETAFETTLPKSGKKVTFKLFRGSDQAIVQKAMRNSEDNDDGEGGVAGLLARLVYIEGCTDLTGRKKFVENLHLADAEHLREQWEYHDIVVQDTIEIECRHCGAIYEVAIPTDARFFSARSARPRKAKSSSAN